MLDEVGRRVEHARDEDLARGQLHALEQPPLVRVSRIGGLEGNAGRPRGEDDVDDVGEGDVVVVRPLVVTPAHVQTRPLRRDVGERVVQRVHVQAGHPAELVEAQVGVLDVPPHPEVGTIDLQVDARSRHRLVLRPHGVGDREQVRLVARVMVVAEEQRDDARGRRRQERVLGLRRVTRRPQIVRVGLGGARVAHADRPVTRRRPATGSPGIAEDALGHLGEVHQVPVLQRMARAAEAVQAVLDVGRVTRLAHLAVVHDRDAGLHLLADDLADGGADTRAQGGRIDRHAFLLREHHPDHVRRTRKTPGVRGEESLGAPRHRHGAAMLTQASEPGRDAMRHRYQAERNARFTSAMRFSSLL